MLTVTKVQNGVPDVPCTSWGSLQFFEVAIIYVVAAPFRYSVELDTVGELHRFTPKKPTVLPFALRFSLLFIRLSI